MKNNLLKILQKEMFEDETQESNFITFNNTVDDMPLKIEKIYGNHSQETGDVTDDDGNVIGTKPSIDYPSEIKVVEDSIKISVANKNLIDITPNTETPLVAGMNYTYTSSSYTLSGTATKTYEHMRLKNNLLFLKPKTTYTFSREITGTNPLMTVSLTVDYINGTREKLITIFKGNIKTIFSLTEEQLKNISHWFLTIESLQVGEEYDLECKVQLEQGSEATDYVEHQSQTYTFPIQQEMLEGDYIDLENKKEVHNWNKIDSYTDEEITTDYISTTGDLSTGATVYYKLETANELDLTVEQLEVVNKINQTAITYDEITNVYALSDELDTNIKAIAKISKIREMEDKVNE